MAPNRAKSEFSLDIGGSCYAFLFSCSAILLLFIVRITLFSTSKHPACAGSYGKKDTMFAALIRFIQEWKRYNQSLNELSRLGDRELADIGISRSDIPRVAWTRHTATDPAALRSARLRPRRRGRNRFGAGCTPSRGSSNAPGA
jgi:uncharacterized protein YjiS (DUF1127 family)